MPFHFSPRPLLSLPVLLERHHAGGAETLSLSLRISSGCAGGAVVGKRHALVAYCLFGLAAMELVRMLSSRGLKSALRAERTHFDTQRGRPRPSAKVAKAPPGWAGVLDDADPGADAYAEEEQDELSALHGPSASRIASSYQGTSATGW